MGRQRVAVAAVGGADPGIELAHRVFHLPAPERGRKLDVVPVPGEARAAGGLQRDIADHRFGQVHDLDVRGVGLVQLEHRELGVVPGADAFVAEVAVDLVDALEAAHDQALEVELRRHAQVELEVERVVVGGERTRGGAAGDVMHHRRLHFEEAARVEPAAHRSDHLRAHHEDLARIRVHDQVDVALAVALLDVGQAVPLVRERAQRLGQQAQRVDLHRQFAGTGAGQPALGGDDVAHVPALEGVIGLAQGIGLEEQLEAAADVLDLCERRLAHHALGQQAPGDGDAAAGGLQRLGIPGVGIRVLVLQVAGVVAAAEIVRERDALPAQRGQFAAALGDEAVFVGGGLGLCGGGHGLLWGGGGEVAPTGRWCRSSHGCDRFGDQTASVRFAPTSSPDFRLASMNSSRSPSSTFWVSERSMPVRRSLIRLWSST